MGILIIECYFLQLRLNKKSFFVINQIKKSFFVINLIFMILNRDTVVFITWLELQ